MQRWKITNENSSIANVILNLLSSIFALMETFPPNFELLRSIGKLIRGLSALFWGLPIALIVCAETAEVRLLEPVGMIPAIASNMLILFGLWQMSSFQKQ